MVSVTAHAEKDAGTKTTLYVGQEEEGDVEEEAREVEKVGGGRGTDRPHHPLMIAVGKEGIRPATGKGKTDGWFPRPLTHNIAGSVLRTPKPSSACTLFAPQGSGSVSGMGSLLPTLFRGRR